MFTTRVALNIADIVIMLCSLTLSLFCVKLIKPYFFQMAKFKRLDKKRTLEEHQASRGCAIVQHVMPNGYYRCQRKYPPKKTRKSKKSKKSKKKKTATHVAPAATAPAAPSLRRSARVSSRK